jgi:hypothetical protein
MRNEPPPPLSYANDEPPEEVPQFPTSWTSAIVIALLLVAAVVAIVFAMN